MRVRVFVSNLAVLVNVCLTSEISIQRGLKQSDPLVPFLFLLLVKGLGGLFRKALISIFILALGWTPLILSSLIFSMQMILFF